MAATTMHVPFPVFDGDNLRSGESRPFTATSTDDAYDVDFVLLGCDPPDDSDDGPFDDDPENGSNSAFGPLFTCLKSPSQSVFPLDWRLHQLAWSSSGSSDRVGVVGLATEVAFRHFSFGKLFQSGTAHLRC
jgi:hypothetical protein